MTSSDLETRLSATFGTPMTPPQRAALDARLTGRLVRQLAPTRSSSRRWSMIAGLVVAVLSLSLVAGVAAEIRLTEDPLGLESASQFAAELAAAEKVVPIPSGAVWPSYTSVVNPSASYSRGGGRSQVEFTAVCLWSSSWLGADRMGDTATRATATAMLGEVRTWGLYTGSDPAYGVRAMIDQLAGAAAQGDPAPLQNFVALNCAP